MSCSRSGIVDLRGLSRPSKALNSQNGQNTNPTIDALDLTFGIEIECLLLQDTRPRPSSKPDLNPLLARQTIHDVLKQPHKVLCSSCGESCEFNLALNHIVEAGNEQSQVDPQYTNWTVDKDSSLDLTDEEIEALGDRGKFMRLYRIEIKSRVIHVNEPIVATFSNSTSRHVHSVSWDAEISSVYERLVEAFNTPPGVGGYRLIVNPSCGLHVHIGNGVKGFPLNTVKNVLSMYVANERAIDTLHSVDRVTGSSLAFSDRTIDFLNENYTDEVIDAGVFNLPWSAHFHLLAFKLSLGEASNSDGTSSDHGYLANEYPANVFWKYSWFNTTAQQNNVLAWLRVICCARDIKDLRQLTGVQYHNTTVNLTNLADFSADGSNRGPFNNKKMTVEFRQHAATLRTVEVISWVHVLLKLFTFCHKQTPLDIQKICEACWSDPTHDALKFLRTIDVTGDAYKHYRTFLGVAPGQKQSYAKEVYLSEKEAALMFGSDDFFLTLSQAAAEERASALSGLNMDRRIKEKLVSGGYGQFEPKYVAQLDVSAIVKKQLTIGWKPDRPDDDDDE